jgi:hypothetical protein
MGDHRGMGKSGWARAAEWARAHGRSQRMMGESVGPAGSLRMCVGRMGEDGRERMSEARDERHEEGRCPHACTGQAVGWRRDHAQKARSSLCWEESAHGVVGVGETRGGTSGGSGEPLVWLA